MRNLILGNQFRRDAKLVKKRGKDPDKLRELIVLLEQGATLPLRYKDDALIGDWQHHRECHIEADWLLIYKIAGNDVHLVRTGSHSDLF